MAADKPSIAYLTAGAGGMICGSCLHDNTLARALIRLGVDAHLIPTYTPIRTDEEDVSNQRVFLGGVNLFLSQFIPGYRFLPSALTRWLDWPWLIRLATRRASATSAQKLGALTVSVLRGTAGFQRREMEELCDWLAAELRPDLVVLSNALIAGCVPQLRQKWDVPTLVSLQGDDIFLETLPEPYRSESLDAVRRLAQGIDGFLCNTDFYASFMSRYLDIPREKIHVIPLGVDVAGFPFPGQANRPPSQRDPLRIGYLARMAPEKGLHVLVDAFIMLRGRCPDLRPQLHIAGWQGSHQRRYVDEQKKKLREARWSDQVIWTGELDRRSKIDFLTQLDVLSVPTTYAEPKGLFVLEAMAAGVPVVQPAHGAFPELLGATGGGLLVAPHDPQAVATGLETLLRDTLKRRALAEQGQAAVHARFNADSMARATWDVLRQYLSSTASPAEIASPGSVLAKRIND